MLGGSAVHFSLAASFFTDVAVVGPVGDDFGDEEYARPARTRRQHRRHRAGRGRQDVLLGGSLRVRPEPGPHRRHAAQRVRRLRAEAVRTPSRSSTTCSWPTSTRQLQIDVRKQCKRRAPGRARLDEPVDRHRARRAGRGDRRGRPGLHERRRGADAHPGAEPRARRAQGDGDGPGRRRRQAGRVRRGAVLRRPLLRAARLPARDRQGPDRRGRLVRRRLPRATSPATTARRPRRTRWSCAAR